MDTVIPKPATTSKLGVYVELHAKPGKEAAVASFLKNALPLVDDEPATATWYALQLGESRFGIFDTFRDEAGREAHLTGKVAQALAEKAPELFSTPPLIHKTEILAFKHDRFS